MAGLLKIENNLRRSKKVNYIGYLVDESMIKLKINNERLTKPKLH